MQTASEHAAEAEVMTRSQPMNIFISANDNYLYAAKVMLTSLFVNNPKTAISVFFMYTDVHPQSLAQLRDLVASYSGSFVPMPITAEMFQDFSKSLRFPVEVYYRFLIPHLLPEDVQRALWLDVDLIVNGSLQKLYDTEFDGMDFAACQDMGDHSNRLEQLGCAPDTPYINSGVILFNVQQMKQYSLSDYLDYYLSHQSAIFWPDQDILNGMFAGRIKLLDKEIFNKQVKSEFALSRSEYRYTMDHAVIVHYTGNYKPWQHYYANAIGELWDRYDVILKNYCPIFRRIYIAANRVQRWSQRKIWSKNRLWREKLFLRFKTLKALRDWIRKENR